MVFIHLTSLIEGCIEREIMYLLSLNADHVLASLWRCTKLSLFPYHDNIILKTLAELSRQLH